MAKKIIIHHELCIGCGSCEAICPEHFELQPDGKAKVIKQYCEEDKDKIEEAKSSCPVESIEIVEEKDKKK